MVETQELKLNEWISPDVKNYSYLFFWKYSGKPNPWQDSIDVYITLKKVDQDYVAVSGDYCPTFTTLDEIRKVMEDHEKTGENLKGVYELIHGDIIVEKICHEIVERTIEDLIEKNLLDIALFRLK